VLKVKKSICLLTKSIFKF